MRRHGIHACATAYVMYAVLGHDRYSPILTKTHLLLGSFADPPASGTPSGLLVLVAPLTISTTAYIPLVKAVQVCSTSHANVFLSAILDPSCSSPCVLAARTERTIVYFQLRHVHRCSGTLQACIGDRMRLAGAVMQVDWQGVLQGSQMMQQPQEFARLAEESVARKMDSVRREAASRGWLSDDLPSGLILSTVPGQADACLACV